MVWQILHRGWWYVRSGGALHIYRARSAYSSDMRLNTDILGSDSFANGTLVWRRAIGEKVQCRWRDGRVASLERRGVRLDELRRVTCTRSAGIRARRLRRRLRQIAVIIRRRAEAAAARDATVVRRGREYRLRHTAGLPTTFVRISPCGYLRLSPIAQGAVLELRRGNTILLCRWAGQNAECESISREHWRRNDQRDMARAARRRSQVERMMQLLEQRAQCLVT